MLISILEKTLYFHQKIMTHNLLVIIETLIYLYLSFLAGDGVFRLAGHRLAPKNLRGVYAIMLGMGFFGMAGLALGLAGFLTPMALRLLMLAILVTGWRVVAAHARIMRSSLSPVALARLVRPMLREHAFFKLLIIFWLAFNFVLAFVPITAHDTKSYHMPIMTAMQQDARITFSPEIFEYSWMPLTGEIIYAIPTIAFANTTAPFVFQLLQYGAFVLLLLIINAFLRDNIRFPFLRFGAILFILGILDLQREALHGGYTDMFVYLFGITSALLLIQAFNERGRIRSPDIALSAVFLGVALGVKLTAIFIAVTNYLFLLSGMIKNRIGVKRAIAHIAAYSLIILLIAGFWSGRNAIVYGDPFYLGGTELYAGRMAVTFVVEPTLRTLFLFPFYKFGFVGPGDSSSKLVIFGYFIFVYAAMAGVLLFGRKKIRMPEILLFAASQIQLMLIFFQSHHTRYMLPSIILLPITLMLLLDHAYEWLQETLRPRTYHAFVRLSQVCLSIACIILFLGNIHYFFVKVQYKTGVLTEQEYIKKIGSQ